MAQRKRKTSDKIFLELTQEVDIGKLRDAIQAHFSSFPDPRRKRSIEYPAWYLLLIILCGYLAGCNTIMDLADFAELKAEWFASLVSPDLAIPAPSYNTLWWFLVRVKPDVFKGLIARWLGGLPKDLRDQLLVIDGKRLRGVSDNEHITHIVELFSAESGLTIAQEKVPDKASERAALPALLDTMDVNGAVISMDALYAHIADVEEILARGANYIVGIKGNQGNLEAEVCGFFEQAKDANYEGVEVTKHETHEKDHGRTESRYVRVVHDLDWLPQRDEWSLESLIEVRSERVQGSKREEAIRYYGSSLRANAQEFAGLIRGHWSIENGLHFVMDVVFREDASLSDTGSSAENMSLIRRLAMNIIKSFDPNRGIAEARRCATHKPSYLCGLLAKVFIKSF